jgi:light-harvesting complex I chlorophyll a/b binding protein 4
MARMSVTAIAAVAFGGADALSFATGGLLSKRGLFADSSSSISSRPGSVSEEPFSPRNMAGVVAPLGFWDPLNFCGDANEGKVRFYREVEVKHGRLAMLAAVGILVAESFHPMFGGNIDVPASIAFQATPLMHFWPAILFAISIAETSTVFAFESPFAAERWTIRSDHVSGDIGFDPLKLRPESPEEFKVMQTKELQNGRTAMIAVTGLLGQELATGAKIFA